MTASGARSPAFEVAAGGSCWPLRLLAIGNAPRIVMLAAAIGAMTGKATGEAAGFDAAVSSCTHRKPFLS